MVMSKKLKSNLESLLERSLVAEVFIYNQFNCYNEVVCCAISFILLQEFGLEIVKYKSNKKKDATPPTNALIFIKHFSLNKKKVPSGLHIGKKKPQSKKIEVSKRRRRTELVVKRVNTPYQ